MREMCVILNFSTFISSSILHVYLNLCTFTYIMFCYYRMIQHLWRKQRTRRDFVFVWKRGFCFLHYLNILERMPYKSNEKPTWCNTVQVLFLQSHYTCFGRKRPWSGVFKTGTAATGTCVIVAGKSSHHLIRAGTECCIKLVFIWLN